MMVNINFALAARILLRLFSGLFILAVVHYALQAWSDFCAPGSAVFSGHVRITGSQIK